MCNHVQSFSITCNQCNHGGAHQVLVELAELITQHGADAWFDASGAEGDEGEADEEACSSEGALTAIGRNQRLSAPIRRNQRPSVAIGRNQLRLHSAAITGARLVGCESEVPSAVHERQVHDRAVLAEHRLGQQRAAERGQVHGTGE